MAPRLLEAIPYRPPACDAVASPRCRSVTIANVAEPAFSDSSASPRRRRSQAGRSSGRSDKYAADGAAFLLDHGNAEASLWAIRWSSFDRGTEPMALPVWSCPGGLRCGAPNLTRSMMEHDARVWIAALRGAHERLVTFVAGASADDLVHPSMCADWDVAQVLSHPGSGAEIGRATVTGTPVENA